MDAQRFGRALGLGTRAAAKALLQAADAAAAPNPRPHIQPPARPRTPIPRPAAAIRPAARAIFAPARRAGSVLFLELTGTFFALFAVAAAFELLKLHPSRTRGYALAMLFVFGFFAVSSFVKARRRARQS